MEQSLKNEFIEEFKEQIDIVRQQTRLERVELLTPHDGDGYLIKASWSSKEAFEQWRNSDAFDRAHTNIPSGILTGLNELETYQREIVVNNN